MCFSAGGGGGGGGGGLEKKGKRQSFFLVFLISMNFFFFFDCAKIFDCKAFFARDLWRAARGHARLAEKQSANSASITRGGSDDISAEEM